jgi:DnaJ-like protein
VSQERRQLWKLPRWESAVERQIREAQERGEFNALPGLGKPLPEEPWQGDWALAFHVLRQAGETLPWIALGKEIEQRRGQLRQLREQAAALAPSPAREAQRARLRERYLEAASELDQLLADYNLLVPTRSLDRGRLPPHVAASQFDQACPP